MAEIAQIPSLMRRVLDGAEEVRRVARKYRDAKTFLYLGRGQATPLPWKGR